MNEYILIVKSQDYTVKSCSQSGPIQKERAHSLFQKSARLWKIDIHYVRGFDLQLLHPLELKYISSQTIHNNMS